MKSTAGISSKRWALVLAGGDGTRLEGVAERLYGRPCAKQFCSFGAPRSLVEETVERALLLVPEARVVVVTTRKHRAEAARCLAGYPALRIIEQPENCGTLPGIALPVLHLQRESPDATLLVLPSDHHVTDDAAFAGALERATRVVKAPDVDLSLVGAVPEDYEEGLGWIVPGDLTSRVRAFREKPPRHEGEALAAGGALVNTFVMAGRLGALAARIARRAPRWWRALTAAGGDQTALEGAYRALPTEDFSRLVLAGGSMERLRVVALRGAGWSDLGTPSRLLRARALRLPRPTGPQLSGERPLLKERVDGSEQLIGAEGLL
jgi:mannose-1-phosphate guanylyltransferase